MIANLKFDAAVALPAILKGQLERLGVNYRLKDFGEFELYSDNPAVIEKVEEQLKIFGITLIDSPRAQLIQKIKNVIAAMIDMEEMPISKISCYIAEQLGMNYSYISTIFSEQTHTSIENYIILQKVEKAKRLLLQDFSLTEISHMLNYSSVAHLSGQFKKTTGLTPTTFKKIIAQRKEAV